MKVLSLASVIKLKDRLRINIFGLITTIFLVIYNQMVCPFLESLPFTEELSNLIFAYIFVLIFREIMFRMYKIDTDEPFISKKIQRLYIYSWIFGGFIAFLIHEIRYYDFDPGVYHQLKPWPSDYHWHSHLKVLSGYWFLGAGLITQLELLISEGIIIRYFKKFSIVPRSFNEQIAFRITWGNFLYAFVPSVAMLITVLRYAIQDMMIPLGVSGEISYIGVVFVLVALAAARIYGRRLRRDTSEITEVVDRIGKGDFSPRLFPTRQDELGLIANGINDMAQGLEHRERIKESFGHFVSPEIADRVIEEYTSGGDLRSRGEKKNVAILMCDIRSFTTMGEKLPPSEMVEMLNDYFDHMVKAIRKHGGIVDKFIGDAVMAVFGLVDDGKSPQLQSVRAAVEMRKELEIFNRERRDAGKETINNGIGIHFGEVVASFLGSSERLEFTVIGSTVNIAARLEAQARTPNPPIIFSREIAVAINKNARLLKVGEAELKGVGKKDIYSIKRKKRSS